jgi:DNA-binding MarR family transcriptional regulator
MQEGSVRGRYDRAVSKDLVDTMADAWARELPPVAGLQFELPKRIARLAAMLSERVGAELARLGLTKAEYEILAVLRASGAPYRRRPSDLTSQLVLTSGGTSNVLRRLTAAALIEREADASDARSSWVRLSGQGVRVAEQAVLAAGRAQSGLLGAIPEDDARAANDALRQVLLALGDTP